MENLAVKVVRKAREAEGIASFELARADGAALPPFSAGSHIDVQVPGGLTRQYSLCNDSGSSTATASPCCAILPRAAVPWPCTTPCKKAT